MLFKVWRGDLRKAVTADSTQGLCFVLPDFHILAISPAHNTGGEELITGRIYNVQQPVTGLITGRTYNKGGEELITGGYTTGVEWSLSLGGYTTVACHGAYNWEDIQHGMSGAYNWQKIQQERRGAYNWENIQKEKRGAYNWEDIQQGMRGAHKWENIQKEKRGACNWEDIQLGMSGAYKWDNIQLWPVMGLITGRTSNRGAV